MDRPLRRHKHRWVLKKQAESLERIQLDQEKDQWRGLISDVMKVCVPYNTGNI